MISSIYRISIIEDLFLPIYFLIERNKMNS